MKNELTKIGRVVPGWIRFGFIGILCYSFTPLFAAFIDPAGKQVLAASTPAFTSVAHGAHTIAYGDNKAYVIYMHDNRTDATKLDFTVAQWDFSTGKLTQALVATTNKTGGNAIHNAGTIVRDPQGFLEIFYAHNDAFYSANGYPYYKRTLAPDNLSNWSAQVPMPQKLETEPHAAFTPNGYLHILLGHASGSVYHHRRDPQGNWSSVKLIDNVTNNNDQAPGYGDWKVVGNTIHMAWCVYQPPFTGGGDGVYYARSEDNGETWTNLGKTASFTRSQGLYQVDPCNPTPPYPAPRTEAPCEYPSPYKVAAGATSTKGQNVDALGDGTVLVTNFPLTGPAILYVGKAGKWIARTVSAEPHYGASIEVTSDNRIVIYSSKLSDMNMFEYVSADTGKTWQSTLVGTNTVQEVGALRVSPPGQDDRMLVAWRSCGANGTYDINFAARVMTGSRTSNIQRETPATFGSLNRIGSAISVRSNGVGGIHVSWSGTPNATAAIYSLAGKQLASFEGIGPQGSSWNPGTNALGVYLVRVSVGTDIQARKAYIGQ